MHARAKRRNRQATPSALFEAVKAVGRTGENAQPILCLELRDVEPFRVALTPAQILSLGAWFASQGPLASRRVREAERARERRLIDDADEERPEISATGRLLAR